MEKDVCAFCGCSDDVSELVKINDNDFACDDCFGDANMPRKVDQHVFRMTGYTVERS